MGNLYGVYFVIVFLIWIIPTTAIVSFIKDQRAAGRFTSAALKVLFALIGCRVHVVGKQYMDTPGAKIYASNHTSNFDVLPLMLGLGVPYHFVAKLEVRHMPFIGTFLKQMGHVWFDRKVGDERLRQSEQIQELLRQGESVFIFPEGTFASEDGVRPFQLGAFKAAVSSGAFRSFRCRSQARANFCATELIFRGRTDVTITLSPPIYSRGAATAADGFAASGIWRLARADSPSRPNPPGHRAATPANRCSKICKAWRSVTPTPHTFRMHDVRKSPRHVVDHSDIRIHLHRLPIQHRRRVAPLLHRLHRRSEKHRIAADRFERLESSRLRLMIARNSTCPIPRSASQAPDRSARRA